MTALTFHLEMTVGPRERPSPFPARPGDFSHNHRQCQLHQEVGVGSTHRAPSHTLISMGVRARVCPPVLACACPELKLSVPSNVCIESESPTCWRWEQGPHRRGESQCLNQTPSPLEPQQTTHR